MVSGQWSVVSGQTKHLVQSSTDYCLLSTWGFLMRTLDLQTRSLTYYWRTNLVVVLGVATAVAVLSGALLVGDSVRASLRDLVLQRLGQTRSPDAHFRIQRSDGAASPPESVRP